LERKLKEKESSLESQSISFQTEKAALAAELKAKADHIAKS
jgi:hypothetical protein